MEQELPNRNKYILWFIILTGIFLRLFHYFNDRSFWEDEIFLSSSIIKMNFAQLATLPLHYEQRAPIGLLMAMRLCVVLLGKHDMVLRLFPLICGIASIFVFIPVSRYFLKPTGALIALAILAWAPPLIYHSVEAKQYSPELLASLLCFYLYIIFSEKTDAKSLIIWGIGGAIILWFSFSSLFILAGIGLSICISYSLKKDAASLFRSFIPFSIWGVSFIANYLLVISKYTDNGWLANFWMIREAFFPLPPHTVGQSLWLFRQLYSVIHYPLGLSWFELDYVSYHSLTARFLYRMPILPMALIVIGTFAFIKHNKKQAAILIWPLLLVLAASAFKFYPLLERLWVFMAPVLIIFVVKGYEVLSGSNRIKPAFKTILLMLILSAPLLNDARILLNLNLFGEYKKSYHKEVLLYLNNHYQPGDAVYVYWSEQPGYEYYKDAYDLKFTTIEGKDARYTSKSFTDYYNQMKPDFDALKGKKRVWVLYERYNSTKNGDFDNQPGWYYNHADAAKNLHAQFCSLGKEVFNYDDTRPSDVRLNLFDLSAAR